MSEKVTLNTLDKGQAVILEKIVNVEKNALREAEIIKEDVEVKHSQNRASIHHINKLLQDVIDDVWKLKVKIAGYSAGAGVITALAVKLVDHLIHINK